MLTSNMDYFHCSHILQKLFKKFGQILATLLGRWPWGCIVLMVVHSAAVRIFKSWIFTFKLRSEYGI